MAMGSQPSIHDRADSVRVVSSWLSDAGLLVGIDATASLDAAVERLLSSGAAAAAAEVAVREWRRRQDNVAHHEAPANEERLLAALLVLDPQLRQTRYRCVPSVTNEAHWWACYLNCLREEVQCTLRSLCKQAEATASLVSISAQPLAPVHCGHLARLEPTALLHLAASFADVESLVRFAATCKSLYPLAHHPQLWQWAFRRDFPDLAFGLLAADLTLVLRADLPTGRQVYMAVAAGRAGDVPPGVAWLINQFLAQEWGDAHVRYGGWGSAHLRLQPLRRTADSIAVRADFEYMYDDGDTVWGGRAAEELCCSVDIKSGRWTRPVPLHASWPGLAGIYSTLAEFDPDLGARRSVVALAAEVELSELSPV